MKLKQVIKYDNANALEATWVENIHLPQQEISPGVFDMVQRTEEVVVKCHSYSDRQMDELRADIGSEMTPEIEALIADVLANQAPLPEPTPPTVLERIAAVEVTITPRRMREATLTDEGKEWLAARDAEIAALRAQL